MLRSEVKFGQQRLASVDLCRMRVGPDGRYLVAARRAARGAAGSGARGCEQQPAGTGGKPPRCPPSLSEVYMV